MKNIKIILLTASIMAGIFTAVIFTACNKVNCTGVVCKNGGACYNGKCSCPTGYSGTFCQIAATGTLVYQNNTFTPIAIVVNGTAATIPVGGTASFTGIYGTVASGTATTSGAASTLGISTAGGVLGLLINWDINNTFPSSDSQRVPLDVGATYFFLRMANRSSYNVVDYYVNYKFSYGQYYIDATIPNNGVMYDMGYYLAYPESNVETQSSAQTIFFEAVTLPATSNQSVSVTAIN